MGLLQARPASGDGEPGELALVDVIKATSADVWRLHAHQVGRDDADDLTQETFLRVMRALSSFRGDSSVRVWVLSIASRVAVDEIRRRQRSRRLLGRLAARPEAADDHSDDHAAGHALLDLLFRLEPDRREAFVLTQILELPYAEAAAVAGCPIGTIRSRVARARADLLEAYQD